MIEILDNESKAKRVAFVFSLKFGGESFTCLIKCLFHAWEFHQNPIFQNFDCIFHSFFCYPSFNHLCLNLLVCFYELMNRWYWILLEVSSVFSLPYSFVVVPLEKKLIFVKVFRWKLFVTTVCINLKSIILK